MSASMGGSGTVRNSGIENTSHQTATDKKLNRAGEGGLGRRQVRPGRQAEPCGLADPCEIQREQEPAADVSERVTGRRNAVDLLGAGDVGEHRVVEDEAAVRAILASMNRPAASIQSP